MTEWILSSSILILIVIALRTVFKGKISLRLQYAIWGLVLLRLLIPVSFGSTDFSVANLTAKTEAPSIVIQSEKPGDNLQADHPVQYPQEQPDKIPSQNITQNEPVAEENSFDLSAYAIYIIWGIGFICDAGLFLLTNLRFKHKLMGSRYGLDVHKNNLDVYATGEIDTPCLFGIKNPAIYVTYPVADNQTLLRHTLEHEATHHRHGDHIWAVLRCVCLAIHWYNPLVWWAAFLSQRDAELACDEATIKRLGEGERAEYGRTLIGMTCQKKANVLITATTMNSGKSGLKERIMLIAMKPKMTLYTLLIVVLVASITVGCTFTGAKDARQEAYEKLPEYLEEYTFEHVKDRMGPEDVHYYGGSYDHSLVYCSGTGPQLILYTHEIDGDQISIIGQANGEYAMSGGLSVNHIVDGDAHIYFGTISDYHWIPEDDSQIPLEWDNLTFYTESGSYVVNTEENLGYIFVSQEPITDFWVVTADGNVPLRMEQYLAQGYTIQEANWNTNISTGEEIRTSVDETRTRENDWGLILLPEDVSRTGATAIFKFPNALPGEEDAELTYGDFLSVERYEKGEWVSVEELPGFEYYVGDSSYPVTDGYGMVHEWDVRFGELPDGHYRIGKNVTLTYADGTSEDRMFYGEFHLPDSIRNGPKPLEELPEKYSAEQAMIDGCFVQTDGVARENKEKFQQFAVVTQQGVPSFIRIVNWHYGDESYYTAMDLEYDGNVYTLTSLENTYTFKYLKRYTGEKAWENADHDEFVCYVLVNDDTLTWEDTQSGTLDMSDSNNPAHWTVYADFIYHPDVVDIPEYPKQIDLEFKGEILLSTQDFDRLEKIYLLFDGAEFLGYEPATHSIGVGLNLILTCDNGEIVTIELDPDNDLCRINGEYVSYGAPDEPCYIEKLWYYLGIEEWPEAVYQECSNAFRP